MRDVNLPSFSLAERDRRHEAVRHEMAARGSMILFNKSSNARQRQVASAFSKYWNAACTMRIDFNLYRNFWLTTHSWV